MSSEKTSVGRPQKLNKELKDKIVRSIRQGNYIETASALAGISKNTLYDWLKRGQREKQRLSDPKAKVRPKEQIFVEFSDAIEKAQAESEADDLRTIKKASREDWKASAWRLERKHPDRWGRKESLKAEVNSQHTETTEVKVEQKLSADPVARELLKQLYRRQMTMETGED